MKRLCAALATALVASLVSVGSASAAPQAKLELTPATRTVTLGDTISVEIRLNTGGGPAINAVQANLSYPSALSCTGIVVNSAGWPVTAQSQCSADRVQIAVGAFAPVVGSMSRVAVVKFKTVARGMASLVFAEGSAAVDAATSTNQLAATHGATYTIQP